MSAIVLQPKNKEPETFESKVKRRRWIRLEARVRMTMDNVLDAAARGQKQFRSSLKYENKDDALCVCEQVIRRSSGVVRAKLLRNIYFCEGHTVMYTIHFKWDEPVIKNNKN